MTQTSTNTSGYRWVILLIFSLLAAVIQLQWLTFAPVARVAGQLYGYSEQPFYIDLLSLAFMVVYVLFAIPASYIIDKYGARIGVGIGAIITAIFSLLKGFFAADYTMVLTAQLGLAIAQPFIINAATKIGSRWFPIAERATAVGIATLAQFLGIIIVMILTPELINLDSNKQYMADGSFERLLLYYGIISAIIALIFLIFMKEHSSAEGEENMEFFSGFKQMVSKRETIMVIFVFFIGLGIFNAVSTVIDQLMAGKGLSVDDSGLVAGVMLIAGVIGAIIVPPISDKIQKRKIFLVIAMAGSVIGLLGLTASNDFTMLLISSSTLGFFLLGIGAPVGFQFTAEISAPTGESTSQGVILWCGQVSGIAFIVAMNTIGMQPLMMVFCVLAVVATLLALSLKESPMMKNDQ